MKAMSLTKLARLASFLAMQLVHSEPMKVRGIRCHMGGGGRGGEGGRNRRWVQRGRVEERV